MSRPTCLAVTSGGDKKVADSHGAPNWCGNYYPAQEHALRASSAWGSAATRVRGGCDYLVSEPPRIRRRPNESIRRRFDDFISRNGGRPIEVTARRETVNLAPTLRNALGDELTYRKYPQALDIGAAELNTIATVVRYLSAAVCDLLGGRLPPGGQSKERILGPESRFVFGKAADR